MTSRTANASQFKRHRAPRKVFDDDDSELPPFDPTALPEAQTAAQLRSVSVWLRCAACALLIWSIIWIFHPKSYQEWHWDDVAILGGLCASGPLIAAAESLWVLRRGKPIEDRLVRGIIKVSTVVLIAVSLPVATLVNGFEANNLLPLFVSVLLLMAMAIFGLLRLKFLDQPVSWTHERSLRWLIVASVAGPAIALMLGSVLTIPLVGVRAAMLAGSNPYCLQVPADRLGNERTVTSLSQLAGLRMQTPRTNGGGTTDYQFAFHSVLVVKGESGNQLYNWSHRELDFLAISTKRGLRVSAKCTPQSDFLYKLDLF